MAQTLDVLPTLLELTGIAPPAGIQGQSLVPLLTGQGQWKKRPAISEKLKTASAGAPPPLDTESFAIVEGDWKLVRNTQRPAGAPEFELYEFIKDPLNKTDVAAQHPDIVARLSKQLEGWQEMATAARLKPDSETTKSLSPELLREESGSGAGLQLCVAIEEKPSRSASRGFAANVAALRVLTHPRRSLVIATPAKGST